MRSGQLNSPASPACKHVIPECTASDKDEGKAPSLLCLSFSSDEMQKQLQNEWAQDDVAR